MLHQKFSVTFWWYSCKSAWHLLKCGEILFVWCNTIWSSNLSYNASFVLRLCSEFWSE